jgi:hypothetical protein
MTTTDGGVLVISGTAFNTVAQNAGFMQVEAGATASSTQVTGGAGMLVFGSANTTVLAGGGAELVGQGGSDRLAIVLDGGTHIVDQGGQSVFSILGNGGTEYVNGVSVLTQVGNGAVQEIDPGGISIGANLMTGGYQLVLFGGFSLRTSINGGQMEIGAGASTGNQAINFGNGGLLQLDDSVNFNGSIANFDSADQIALADIAFGANTTLAYTDAGNNSGTLTVTDGANTANITLLGQYVAADFALSAFGGGGTLITDPPSNTTRALLAASHA